MNENWIAVVVCLTTVAFNVTGIMSNCGTIREQRMNSKRKQSKHRSRKAA